MFFTSKNMKLETKLKYFIREFENRNAHVVPLQRRKGTEDPGLKTIAPKPKAPKPPKGECRGMKNEEWGMKNE